MFKQLVFFPLPNIMFLALNVPCHVPLHSKTTWGNCHLCLARRVLVNPKGQSQALLAKILVKRLPQG